jgi:hypothetical protein
VYQIYFLFSHFPIKSASISRRKLDKKSMGKRRTAQGEKGKKKCVGTHTWFKPIPLTKLINYIQF